MSSDRLTGWTPPVRAPRRYVGRRPDTPHREAGSRIDPPVSVPMRSDTQVRSDRRPRAAARAPRDPVGCGGIDDVPEGLVPGGRAECELVHVRLAEDHRARGAQATRHLGVGARRRARRRDASRRSSAHRRRRVVLHDDGQAIERQRLAARAALSTPRGASSSASSGVIVISREGVAAPARAARAAPPSARRTRTSRRSAGWSTSARTSSSVTPTRPRRRVLEHRVAGGLTVPAMPPRSAVSAEPVGERSARPPSRSTFRRE